MPLEPPPIPLTAVFGAFPGPHVDVTFDRALRPGGLDNGNWFCRRTNQAQTITAAAAAGAVVSFNIANLAPDVGADVVSYSPPPFDVRSDFGKVAQAFADFPLT